MMRSFTAFVLDKDFTAIWPLDRFTAFIWNEQFWEASDFQLEVPWDIRTFSYVKVGNYLYLRESDELMIIETIGITYDSGNRANRKIVAKGRSMASILDRRIIWGEWSFENIDFQTAMLTLVRDAIVSPKDTRRKISIIRTARNSAYPDENFSGSGFGDNLYDVIKAGCEEKNSGFRIVYNDDTRTNTFKLYKGVDRSYSQTKVPPVVFSGAFENIGPSRYAFDTKEYKTVAFVRGAEDDGYTTVEVGATNLTGLNRREMYLTSSATEPDQIAQKGMEELAKINTLETLDAELDAKRQFAFGKDFFIGDIVQVITDFGLDARAIVIGFIKSWDETGYQEVPTFKILEG